MSGPTLAAAARGVRPALPSGTVGVLLAAAMACGTALGYALRQ